MKALVILTFIIMNSCLIHSQSFQEAGLYDPSIAGVSYTKSTVGYKIYQNSANIVNFDIPEASYVKIGIYDKYDNLVRTYI